MITSSGNSQSVGQASPLNSSSAALGIGGVFTGSWQDVSASPSVALAVMTDQAGTLQAQFSPDGVNADSTLSFSVSASTNEVHRIGVTRRYFRAVFTNTSGVAQTFFRLQCLDGSLSSLTSFLNTVVQQDADALIVRAIDSEIDIAAGRYVGFDIVNKFGLNPDIDTAAGEDVWGGDGFYTGWATAAETLQVFSASANDAAAGTGARTIRITGLDANYAVLSETVTLNGTTPVTTTGLFLRAHTATIVTAGSGGVNAGAITIRQSTTTANIMLTMAVGRNQTNNSAYTVPAGHTGYMRHLHAACGTASSVAIDGNIWTRPFNGVFRSRRPFFLSNASRLTDPIYGGLVFTEKSDIVIRINSVSANNTPVNAGYDLLLVAN